MKDERSVSGVPENIDGEEVEVKDEKELLTAVTAAKNGEDGAFEKVYEMSLPFAYSAASALLKSKEDIEDALQNSFLYVSKYISDLRIPEAYLKWLNKIVINECRKILIDHTKRFKIFSAEKTHRMMNDVGGDKEFENLEKIDLAQTVKDAIEGMPPKKRDILKLYYFEHLSYTEIAERLDIPQGTVMSRLHGAKKELEKRLKAMQKDGTVLWSLPVLPLAGALFAYNVKSQIPAALAGQAAASTASAAGVSAASSAASSSGAAASASLGAGASASAGGAAAAAGASVAVKAAAIAVAATVAVGSGAAAKKVIDKRAFAAEAAYTEQEFIESTDSHSQTDLSDESLSAQTNEGFTEISLENGDFSQNSSSAPSHYAVLPADESNSPTVKNANSGGNKESAKTQTPSSDKEENASTTAKEKSTWHTERTKADRTATKADEKPSPDEASVTETSAETTSSSRRSETTTKNNTTTTRKSAATTTQKSVTTTTAQSSADDFSVSDGVLGKYSGSSSSVTVPSSVNGSKVTAIGARAFEGSSVTSVTIPDGVAKIGQMAFSDCALLTSVTLPSTLTSIGDCAFDGCAKLKSITIPSSVVSIGDDAFDGCDELVIRCSEGSYAQTYAEENSIDYVIV